MAGMQTQAKDRELVLTPGVPANNEHCKQVPPHREMRGIIRRECWSAAANLDHRAGLSQSLLERSAQRILDQLDLPVGFLGWTMVVLASEYWRDQVAAVPHSRRLLLLPPETDDKSLAAFAALREEATQLGMTVATTESSTAIMEVLLGGGIDAIVGVASLDVLEKALDKILLVGIPALAVPLLSSRGDAPQFDADWAQDMLHVCPVGIPPAINPYRALLQEARKMFLPEELARLLPRQQAPADQVGRKTSGPGVLDPLGATETLAHDFLTLGGKYARPFITLAAFDAMTATEGTPSQLPDAVRRVAISIETFHKASLVHDDIEDADDFRYGKPALHKSHGLSTAINVGDYMVGLGYSLVSHEADALGADVVGDLLRILSDAHIRLSAGQGAELLWRDTHNKQLTPAEALRIYALKTSPAFEAALLSGLRCAAPVDDLMLPVKHYCEHLGVAFQILNDLKDWQGDDDNKLGLGLDALGGRPTVLWAMALAGLSTDFREELLNLVGSDVESPKKIHRVRELYQLAGVFDKAAELVRERRVQAEAIACNVSPQRLQELLRYLIEIVLEGSASLTKLAAI